MYVIICLFVCVCVRQSMNGRKPITTNYLTTRTSGNFSKLQLTIHK